MLLYEYYDESGTKSYRKLYAINKDILQLEARLMTVGNCIAVLSVHPVTECENILKKMGYKYTFDQGDKEGYAKTIGSIVSKSKTIIVALNMKRAERDAIIKAFGGKDITENDFTNNLVELSRFMKFHIRAQEITVSEYVQMMKSYIKESEQLQQISDKIKK